MSTIQADTLAERDGSESIPVDTVIHGTAKAWVNFNGTGTVAIRDSFNVPSVTDNGTGDYTTNFTAPMPDANYSVVGMVNRSAGLYNWLILHEEPATARSTSAVRVQANQSGTAVDTALVNVAVFG